MALVHGPSYSFMPSTPPSHHRELPIIGETIKKPSMIGEATGTDPYFTHDLLPITMAECAMFLPPIIDVY